MDNPKFKKIILTIKNDVESGQSLSGALSKYPDVFNNLYVNMMAAAEVSGSLASMLEQLAHYLDQEAETRSQVRGAMVYPGIIAFMAVTVTVFLLDICIAAIYGDLCRQRAVFAEADKNNHGRKRIFARLLVFPCAGDWRADMGVSVLHPHQDRQVLLG